MPETSVTPTEILTSTLHSLAGYETVEHLGMVSGAYFIAKNAGSDFFAGV